MTRFPSTLRSASAGSLALRRVEVLRFPLFAPALGARGLRGLD